LTATAEAGCGFFAAIKDGVQKDWIKRTSGAHDQASQTSYWAWKELPPGKILLGGQFVFADGIATSSRMPALRIPITAVRRTKRDKWFGGQISRKLSNYRCV